MFIDQRLRVIKNMQAASVCIQEVRFKDLSENSLYMQKSSSTITFSTSLVLSYLRLQCFFSGLPRIYEMAISADQDHFSQRHDSSNLDATRKFCAENHVRLRLGGICDHPSLITHPWNARQSAESLSLGSGKDPIVL